MTREIIKIITSTIGSGSFLLIVDFLFNFSYPSTITALNFADLDLGLILIS